MQQKQRFHCKCSHQKYHWCDTSGQKNQLTTVSAWRPHCDLRTFAILPCAVRLPLTSCSSPQCDNGDSAKMNISSALDKKAEVGYQQVGLMAQTLKPQISNKQQCTLLGIPRLASLLVGSPP